MSAGATVGTIMSRLVMTTRPDARLDEAARVLREFHVSGLPVVDAKQRVVGVVSEKDLVTVLYRAAGVALPRGLLDLLLESAPRRGQSILTVCRNRLRNGRVHEVMSRPAVTIDATASIERAAKLLRARGVNRLPVVDPRGRLVGIVTRADVMGALVHRPSRSRGGLRPRPAVTRRRGSADPYGDA